MKNTEQAVKNPRNYKVIVLVYFGLILDVYSQCLSSVDRNFVFPLSMAESIACLAEYQIPCINVAIE
jgi:hypothetical protein